MKIGHKTEIKTLVHSFNSTATEQYDTIRFVCAVRVCMNGWMYVYHLLEYIFFRLKISLSDSFLCCTKYPIIY